MTNYLRYKFPLVPFWFAIILIIANYSSSTAQIKPTKKNSVELVNAFLDSAKVIAKRDLLLALPIFKKALLLSKKTNHFHNQAEAYYGILNIYYNSFDYQLTDKFADSILQIAPNDRYKMLAIERKGDVQWYSGRFDSAAHYYHQVKTLAEQLNDSSKLATIQRDLGDYFRQTGDYNTSIHYFDKAIHLLKELNDTTILPDVYNNFSLVFASVGDYPTQLEYLLKAVDLKKPTTDYSSLALYYKNIADVYIQLKEYETALLKIRIANTYIKKKPFLRYDIYIKEATGRAHYYLNHYDSAVIYLEQALYLCDSVGEKRYQARINKTLGDLAAKNSKYKAANAYYQKSIGYYKIIEDPVFQVKTIISLAKNNFQLEKVKAGYIALLEAKKIAKTFGNNGVLLEIYQLLSLYHEKLNNLPLSIHYFKKSDSIKDLVFSEDRAKYIAINEIAYETKKRDLENFTLKQNIAQQNAVFDKQTTRIKFGAIIILAFIIIALVLYYAYRKTRLSKLKVAVQNKQLQLKNQEIEKINQQQMDLIHLVAHDLKSPLNKIIGLTSILKLENNLSHEQTGIIQMMEDISTSSRMFIINLLEAQDVERMALEPSFRLLDIQEIFSEAGAELRQLVTAKKQQAILENKIRESLFIKIDKELMQHVLLNLFSNAIKFSPTHTRIYFQIYNDAHFVYLSIRDEGPGFTSEDQKKIYSKFQKLSAKPTNKESSTGLGLYLVRSLLLKMSGQINLKPSDTGAHFEIKFKYKK